MKIVIVNNYPLLRKGLFSALCSEPGFEVVGEAGDLNEAILVISNSNPDQVLIDYKLGSEFGMDLVEKVDKGRFNCRFILMASLLNGKDLKRVEELDIDGVISKEALPEELIYAMKIVGKGRKYFDPSLIDIIMKEHRNNGINNLTFREEEILVAVARGLSNKEIAVELNISECTVKKHMSKILSKLKLSDRTQAAIYANNKGLVRAFSM